MKRGIDHIVICVRDLDQAVGFYRGSGFTVTPRAQHPWGTDNCLVQFDGCFLELLTVARPEKIETPYGRKFSFGAYNQKFLTNREGISMLAFASSSALADRDEFISRGLSYYDNFHFKRKAKLPEGELVEVAFTLAFTTASQIPEAVFFCCEQHAPQYFWKSEFQAHRNNALSIGEIILVSPNLAGEIDFFAKIQECESVSMDRDMVTVTTPRGKIVIYSSTTLGNRYPELNLSYSPGTTSIIGYSVLVQNLDAQCTRLRKAGIEYYKTTDMAAESIWISPQQAMGTMIEFKEIHG